MRIELEFENETGIGSEEMHWLNAVEVNLFSCGAHESGVELKHQLQGE